MAAGALFHPNPAVTWEESFSVRALSTIPIIGIILDVAANLSLDRKIASERMSRNEDAVVIPRIIYCIQAKNNCKDHGLTRSVLTIAFIVSFLAKRAISPFLGSLLIAAIAVGILKELLYIERNVVLIRDAQANGTRTVFNDREIV